jgi:hypothetical protein
MNGFHPAIAAALVAQRQTDLLHAAKNARLVSDSTDTPDRARHSTPLRRPAWWTRVTAPLLVSRAAQSA